MASISNGDVMVMITLILEMGFYIALWPFYQEICRANSLQTVVGDA